MDTNRFRRGLTISHRIVVTREWRLFGGMILAVVGYLFWVGATGSAISQIASFANISTAVDPWTSETTGLAALAIVLWILLPAIAAVVLVDREVTNVRNNLEQYYRIHPLLLLVPPLVILLCTLAALAVVGRATRPVLAVALVAALYFQIRTLTYSYRVFSFSFPRIQQFGLFLTSTVLFLTLLVEGAIALGRDEFAADAAAGFSDVIGVSGFAEIVDGTTTVAGFSVPVLLATATATPLVLGGGYVCLQLVVGVGVRILGNEIPRSQLRTGQRYPDFARPTTSQQSSSSTGVTAANSQTDSSTADSSRADPTTTDSQTANSTAGASSAPETADDQETADDGQPEDETEDVTHTRVFTPPTEDDQTEIPGGGQTDSECPFCEAELAAGADSCHNCGASL